MSTCCFWNARTAIPRLHRNRICAGVSCIVPRLLIKTTNLCKTKAQLLDACCIDSCIWGHCSARSADDWLISERMAEKSATNFGLVPSSAFKSDATRALRMLLEAIKTSNISVEYSVTFNTELQVIVSSGSKAANMFRFSSDKQPFPSLFQKIEDSAMICQLSALCAGRKEHKSPIITETENKIKATNANKSCNHVAAIMMVENIEWDLITTLWICKNDSNMTNNQGHVDAIHGSTQENAMTFLWENSVSALNKWRHIENSVVMLPKTFPLETFAALKNCTSFSMRSNRNCFRDRWTSLKFAWNPSLMMYSKRFICCCNPVSNMMKRTSKSDGFIMFSAESLVAGKVLSSNSVNNADMLRMSLFARTRLSINLPWT